MQGLLTEMDQLKLITFGWLTVLMLAQGGRVPVCDEGGPGRVVEPAVPLDPDPARHLHGHPADRRASSEGKLFLALNVFSKIKVCD